jgi:hypothetical protein
VRRQQLEQLLKAGYDTLNELERQIMVTTPPLERQKLTLDKENLRRQLQEYEAELGAPGTRCPTPPNPPEYFGGRDTPLAELKQKLKQGQTTAITAVQGLGGIGKTTLARQLAHDLFYKDKVFRAVLWSDIGREPNGLLNLFNWAYLADPTYSPGDIPREQLAHEIKSMLEGLIEQECAECEPPRVLVVLDDVWDNGREVVKRLRLACPQPATVLITTRSQQVAVKLGAKPQSLDRLDEAEGVAMLQQYLPEVLDEALLAQVVKALGGHPLALTLAAKRALLWPNPQRALKEQLAQYQKGLAAGEAFSKLKLATGESREENLELVLSYSYEGLSEEEAPISEHWE